MIQFLSSLSLWALAIVLNVWLMGFALASLWAVRRWNLLPRLHGNTNAGLFFGAAVLQSALVLYGLVAALTAVTVWQRHEAVAGTVSNEATAISSLWRDLGGYPQREREAMRKALRDYTDQIIREAWPLQRQGKTPARGVKMTDDLQALLFAFEPVTEGQKILHGQTLSAFNRLAEARRLRIDAVSTALPTVMWFVLLPGALGCLLLAVLYAVEDARLHAILLTALAGFLAMVLFVIISLDRPFQGPMAIGADSYQLVFDMLMTK